MVIFYSVLIAIGVIILLGSVVGIFEHDMEFDTHIDVGDAHDGMSEGGVFSLRSIAAFLSAFGLGALLGHYNGFDIGWQILFGFIGGIIAGFIVVSFMKLMYSMQGNSSNSTKSLLGSTAKVIVPTVSTGIAKISIKATSGYAEYICKEKTNQPLLKDDLVTIINEVGNIFIVEKINN